MSDKDDLGEKPGQRLGQRLGNEAGEQKARSEESESAVFSATLTPYRSLGPRGFLVLMAVVIASSFTAGVIFWIIGAWPVVGFFGLDVALLHLAFRLNYRSARAFEEIEVTRRELTVRKVDRRGRARVFSFNPYWSRLEIDRSEEWGITEMRLASQGARLPIGGFLNPDDRESFAKALTAALAEVRSVPSV